MAKNCIGNGFTDLMEEYGVKKCIYGHLHGRAHASRIPHEVRGIEYVLTSSDYLGFEPLKVGE